MRRTWCVCGHEDVNHHYIRQSCLAAGCGCACMSVRHVQGERSAGIQRRASSACYRALLSPHTPTSVTIADLLRQRFSRALEMPEGYISIAAALVAGAATRSVK